MSVRVILLSTEGTFIFRVDSVSGLHLSETTHIFVVHPFWLGDHRQKEADVAEKQGSVELTIGIARAFRRGLTHPLHVIRFVTRGAIEETLQQASNPQQV